jgi:hypothetical protein
MSRLSYQIPGFADSNADNTTATLRLTYQGNLESVQRNYEVQKEQSSDSVVNGFALVGGAWTFINGVFATVFGCRLLLVLFGKQPSFPFSTVLQVLNS